MKSSSRRIVRAVRKEWPYIRGLLRTEYWWRCNKKIQTDQSDLVSADRYRSDRGWFHRQCGHVHLLCCLALCVHISAFIFHGGWWASAAERKATSPSGWGWPHFGRMKVASKFLFPLLCVGYLGEVVYLIWFASGALWLELLFLVVEVVVLASCIWFALDSETHRGHRSLQWTNEYWGRYLNDRSMERGWRADWITDCIAKNA